MTRRSAPQEPPPPPTVKVVTLTEADLEALIRRVTTAAVSELLAAQQGASQAAGASQPAPPAGKTLSQAQVRALAKCGANQVSAALQSGQLRGRKEKRKNRVTVGGPDDERTIPSFEWRIDYEDAMAWIRSRAIDGMPPAPGPR